MRKHRFKSVSRIPFRLTCETERDETEEDIKRGEPRQRQKEEEGLTFTVASRSDGIFRLNLYQKDGSSRSLLPQLTC